MSWHSNGRTGLHPCAAAPCHRASGLLGWEQAAARTAALCVFHGVVCIINTVFVEGERVRNGAFHTVEWERLDWHFTRKLTDMSFPRPVLLDTMVRAAARLGRGFEHLRIDFYDCDNRFWVGEMTVYSWSGLVPFVPDAADYQLGTFWHLRRPFLRALSTVLTRPWDIRPDLSP